VSWHKPEEIKVRAAGRVECLQDRGLQWIMMEDKWEVGGKELGMGGPT